MLLLDPSSFELFWFPRNQLKLTVLIVFYMAERPILQENCMKVHRSVASNSYLLASTL